MVFEICASIATLVFIILAIYIIRTLITLQRALNKINAQIDPLAQETLSLLKNGTAVTGSVQDKLEAFDPLFDGIQDLNCAIKQTIRQEQEEKKKPWQDTVANVVVLAATGIKLWQQIKKGDHRCPK